jgi:hypothetical protein
MDLTKTNNGQWKPGQTGNPNGRPVGARQYFSSGFLRDLAEVWTEHGKDTPQPGTPASCRTGTCLAN